MTKEEAQKRAKEWANIAWDESDLPTEERSDPSTIELAKTCAEIGYMQCFADMTSGKPDCYMTHHITKGFNLASAVHRDPTTCEAFHEDSSDCEWETDQANGWRVASIKLLVLEDRKND